MDNERTGFTEAQAQIEKLKKLKEQKDQADKLKKEDEFRFAELPHAVTKTPVPHEPAPLSVTEMKIQQPASEEHSEAARRVRKPKKTQRTSRLDRKNVDRIKKTVGKIKEAGNGIRLSDDMFVNMALEKILDLKIDFSQAKTTEDVRAIIGKIKAE